MNSSKRCAISVCRVGRLVAQNRVRTLLSSQRESRAHRSFTKWTALPPGSRGRPEMLRSNAESSQRAHVNLMPPLACCGPDASDHGEGHNVHRLLVLVAFQSHLRLVGTFLILERCDHTTQSLKHHIFKHLNEAIIGEEAGCQSPHLRGIYTYR